MIKIWTLDVGGGTFGNGPNISRERFGVTRLEAFIAFPQRLRNGTSHRLASDPGDGLRKAVSFRILDVQAHVSTFLYHSLPVFIITCVQIPGKEISGCSRQCAVRSPAEHGAFNSARDSSRVC